MINKANNQQDETSSDSLKILKKRLTNYLTVGGIVLGATLGTFGTINSAYAGDGDAATTEKETGEAASATDTAGILVDADGAGTLTITVTLAADIAYGTAGGNDSITSASTGTAASVFNITDASGAANTLSLLGDITLEDSGGDDTMVLNLANANLSIGNNIVNTRAGNSVAINAGSTGDVTITVDNEDAGAQGIDATITGTTNTVTLNVTDTTGNAAVTTFTKAVSITGNLNINPTDDETAEVTFDQAVTAGAIVLGDSTDAADDATTLTFEAQTAAHTITGTINNAVAADETAIHITDVTNAAADIITFASDIGNLVPIDAISIGSSTLGGSAVFNGDVSATAFNILGGNAAAEDNLGNFKKDLTATVTLTDATGDATISFSGAAAQTMTGAITTAADNKANLVTANTGGVVTFGAVGTDALKLKTVTIAASNEAVFGGAVAATTLTVAGTATIKAADNESEVVIIGDGAILILDDTITNGLNVFNEVLTTAPAVHANAKIYMPVNLSDAQTVNFFVGEANGTIGDASGNDTELDATMQDTALISYDAALNTATNGSTVVTASAKAEATTASELTVTTNNARALKQALSAAINDTVADATAEDAFNNALNALGGMTATTDTDLALQVAPQTDTIGGSAVSTRAMTGTVQGIVSNRMASLRSGDAYVTGMSAGNGMSANSGFIQAFGSEAEQKNTTISGATNFGYDSETSGVAIGFDGMTDDGSTIGLSASFSTTDVDGKGTGQSKNSIDSYTVSVYADKATESGYIEGSLTYGINDNTSTRLVNTAGLSRTYAGNYDSNQLSLKFGGGMPNEVQDGTFVTPFASATGTIISTDAYTETSNTASDALRLRIAQDDINSIVGTVGVKAHMITDNGTPMISFAINNEFGDTTIDSTNTYQGGGTAFTTSTAVEELSATLGLGYSFGNDVTSLNVNYEANANEDDYVSHYGTIKIVSKF
jgi:hypothetical protein